MRNYEKHAKNAKNNDISPRRSASGTQRGRRERSSFFTENTLIFHRLYTPLFAFWLILAISAIFSRENSLALFGLAKFTQFFLIFVYIKQTFSREKQNSRNNKNLSREKYSSQNSNNNFVISHYIVFWLILASSSLQAVLGIYQYVAQRSVGLAYLGEEFIRPGLPGIAEFFSREIINPYFYEFFPYLSLIFDGARPVIRAYGTFPHPNVLAGFLLVGWFCGLFLAYSQNSLGLLNKRRPRLVMGILGLFLFLTGTGLALTFSRLAWFAAAAGTFIWFLIILWKFRGIGRLHPEGEPAPVRAGMKTSQLDLSALKYKPGRLLFILIVILLTLGINLFWFGAPIQDRIQNTEFRIQNTSTDYLPSESVSQRQLFNEIAWAMIKDNPLIGVGARNYVAAMDQYSDLADEEFKVQERLKPFLHQPVHNVYLLVAAEAGALALVSFLVLIFTIILRRIRVHRLEIIDYTLLIIVIGLLFIGLFDHYLLTIQQGGLLFWTMLGLVVVDRG